MTTTRWLAPLLVVLGAVFPVRAQIKLEWHFKEGESFNVERVFTQKQTVEIKSKAFKEQRTKTWLTAVTVKDKTAAGHILELKVESVVFQSAGAKTKGGFDDTMAARMKGCTFLATVTSQGKVVKLEGYDAFIKKLTGNNAEEEKALKTLLSEDTFRQDIDEMFHFLPDKPVRKGDKWKRDAVEPVPPFGSFKSVFEYMLEEESGDEVVISTSVKMSYRPPSADSDLFRVVKGTLQADEGNGRIVFNAKKGRLTRSEKTFQVRGDLVIESMGTQTSMGFTSENSVRARVFSRE